MNKNKLYKVIDQLKNQIKATYEQHPKTYPYIWAWVVGTLSTIEAKARGEGYYPYRTTYATLLKDFLHYFNCESISEEIKAETLEQLHTAENIKLVEELKKIIK